jgi:hypothetical protein
VAIAGENRDHTVSDREHQQETSADDQPGVRGPEREGKILSAIPSRGGVMAKRHGRPSAQYRYEHYDPRFKPLPG